jgi:hypothetical protein
MGRYMMLKKNEIEGIYYSNKTGRIFEAILDGHGYVITRYCDDSIPEFGPCTKEYQFRIQHLLDVYETLVTYNEDA